MSTSVEAVALSNDELMLYARQILLDDWGITAQENLKRSTAIIIGAGGLGCPVSETLARAGVGRLFLIDDDVIELSNLQRQTLFTPADVGKYKAATAANALKQMNPFIDVHYNLIRVLPDSLDAITALFPSPSSSTMADSSTANTTLLLDCTDNFAIRMLLNELSVTHSIPLLSASAIAMSGQLALFEPHKNTGCYHCVFGKVLSNQENLGEGQNCATSGVLGSTTTVMGSLQANAALQYLGAEHNPLAGVLLNWDGKRMSQYTIRYAPDKQCPVCA